LGANTNACQVVRVADVYEKRRKAAADKFSSAKAIWTIAKLSHPGRHRRRSMGHSGPLARGHSPRGARHGKDVYLEKAHVPQHRRGQAPFPDGKGDQAGAASRIADHLGPQCTWPEVHRRWRRRQDAYEPGPIIVIQGRRMELALSTRRPARRQGRNTYRPGKMLAGKAPKRAYECRRLSSAFAIWDYSGGPSPTTCFPRVAPLDICWSEPQFPHQGIGQRRNLRLQGTPDASARHFPLNGGVPQGHSLVPPPAWPNFPIKHPRPDPRATRATNRAWWTMACSSARPITSP